MSDLEIVWTKVDEAPGLATFSLLPIVEAFVGAAGVKMKLKDISLTGRLIAHFPDTPPPTPQLKAAINELQSKGYDVPNYPDSDATSVDKEIRARYGKVLGRAVNAGLREE